MVNHMLCCFLLAWLWSNIYTAWLQHQYKYYGIVGIVNPSYILIILLKKKLDSFPRIIVLFLVKLYVPLVVIFRLERNPLNYLETQNNFFFSFSSFQPNVYGCSDLNLFWINCSFDQELIIFPHSSFTLL